MRREEDLRVVEPSWPWRVLVASIVVTLLALVVVPWEVQRRVTAMRSQIVASEPARTLVLQWQFSLLREMSALGEYLLSGDTTEVQTYGRALSSETEIQEQLGPLIGQLGSPAVEEFLEARGLAERWHARVTDERVLRERQAGGAVGEIPRERQLFERLLAEVAEVDSAIVGVTAATRDRIATAERRGLRLMAVLAVLALFASGAVIALDARVRRTAREAERRREIAAAALAESSRVAEARTRLLRGITHDVKNPLGAARGYAELLAMEVKGPLAPEQRPLVEGVERSINSALAIIADLLDLARVGSGGVSVERVEVDLNDVALEAGADYDAAARTAGHTLVVEPASEPVPAHTDPLRVRQVLDNLVSNAIKYTPAPGRITIRAASDAGAEGTWAVVEVSDTGPGIPVEQREAVFDEFSRLDERSPVKGHGLGLAIARGLARHLGGDLSIGDGGPGATFVLRIPQRSEASV